MTENTTEIQNIFSSIAKKYDTLNTILTLNIDKLWRRKAIKLCDLKENHKVLDLCCGTGQMVEFICKYVGKNTEVIGLDFNFEMINVGNKRLHKSIKDYKFNLIYGDVLELPFHDDTFDCITIAFGLRNVSDISMALFEMYRVLKPGGKLVCLELSNPTILIFKNIYGIYFNYAVPLIGFLGTRDKKAYYYLRDSVNDFFTKDQLMALISNQGFNLTGFTSLTYGIASIHYGIK
ncbi:MAG: bifunctional demethylmenaquinone methyltransferase/2-methoxy-6-polyprenyl-1,4-benzoquinol methylase UbiE [Clostridiaceae bacterium]